MPYFSDVSSLSPTSMAVAFGSHWCGVSTMEASSQPPDDRVERVEDGDVRVEIDHLAVAGFQQLDQRLALHRGAGLDDVVLEHPGPVTRQAELRGVD